MYKGIPAYEAFSSTAYGQKTQADLKGVKVEFRMLLNNPALQEPVQFLASAHQARRRKPGSLRADQGQPRPRCRCANKKFPGHRNVLQKLPTIRVQRLFALAVTLKISFAIAGYLVGDPLWLGMACPMLVMILYMYVGYNKRESDVSEEKFADSCYYLGFESPFK